MKWHTRSKRLCAILSVFCLAFSLCSPVCVTEASEVVLPYNSLSGSMGFGYQFLPDPSSSETKYLPFNAEEYATNYLRYSPYWFASSYGSLAVDLNYDLTVAFNDGIRATPVHCIFSISLLTRHGTFTVDNGASFSSFVLSGGSEYGFADAISVSFVNQVPWSDIYQRKFPGGDSADDYAAPRIYRVDLNRTAGNWDALVDGFTLRINNWAHITSSQDGYAISYCPVIFNCYAWYDTGDSAIDDVVSSILEHVASIDGKMDTVHASLMDIITQLQELNKDTDTIVDLLTSIDIHLTNVDQTTSDIYKLLRETLTDESTELSNASKSAAETIMQQQDSEQYWTDKNTDTFEKLDLNNFSFSDSILSGLQLVGNMFSSVWSAIGDVSIIYIFPLTLGVALVVIGRIAKSGGKGNKKDGGDSS